MYSSSGHVDVDVLRHAYLSKDEAQVERALGGMLTSRTAADSIDFLKSVWVFDPNVVGDLDDTFIRRPSVRTYEANVLAQMVGNRVLYVDLGPVRMALRAGLNIPDKYVRYRAADGLSYVAETEDVDRLSAMAESPDSAVANQAIAALANACGEHAADTLERFISNSRNPEVKRSAETIRDQLRAARMVRCASS
jgi:hypothetical protein